MMGDQETPEPTLKQTDSYGFCSIEDEVSFYNSSFYSSH